MQTGTRRASWAGGIGAVLAALVGIGVAVAPGATAQAALPPVTPEQLVQSVLTAKPGPFNGTVEVDNALGLPALPGVPQAANGKTTARIWSAGDGKGKVSLPTPQGERTFVADGTTRWSYNSEDRTVTRAPQNADEKRPGPPDGATTDPAAAATKLIGTLSKTSTVAVDGTGEVAGRPVYQLVLTPKPTERTLLREVRIAVDGEKRMPLQLTVLTNGSPAPALQAGFTDVTFGPQDPALFTFTPPPGSTVKDEPARPGPDRKAPGDRPAGTQPKVVGDGWDAVIVATRPSGKPGQAPGTPPGTPAPGTPAPGTPAPGAPGTDQGDAPDLSKLGTPVSGPWGTGRQITTAVGTVIITDDGRIAAGAVPPQVVIEALAK